MTTSIGLSAPILTPLLPVTGFFALPFAVYNSLLSWRVVSNRLADKHYLGDNSSASSGKEGGSYKENKLFRASRCHQNFVENVPLAFILAATAELNGGNRSYLTAALASLFALRVAHSEFGLLKEGGMGLGRPVGYFGTIGVQLGLAGYAAYLVKSYWGF
ncbi:hypothetical protein SLS62_010594 [Diatrype stigma]|uniref:Membrane-associated proteins in eicosanoid and glutathione metabolism n=1 Tax=Diatrype stigma TaxID=117547 RepID=A0AAN9UAT5_9PEZI